MREDDLVRLRHMPDAAHEAISFIQGKGRDDLDNNRMLELSLIRSIEVIGEAAGQVTEGLQKEHPEIPRAESVGMRNRLIHAYFDIDRDRLWDTVTADLPPLIEQLQRIIPSSM